MTEVALPAATGDSAGGSLQHARLDLYEAPAHGQSGPVGVRKGQIEFQFNPKEISLSKSAEWKRVPSRNAPSAGPPEFKGAGPSSMTIEAFFDATAQLDTAVAKATRTLMECCALDPGTTSRNQASPPWVVFRWGGFSAFMSFVKQVQVKYTLFRPDGVPVRATASISLEEISGPVPPTNPTSGGTNPTRQHIMTDGDSLPALAYAEYGAARRWRAVAAANGIDDPARIRSGSRILLPSATELPR